MSDGLCICVEILPGTLSSDAAFDLCKLADNLGVSVKSAFNGVVMLARPGDSPSNLLQAYRVLCDTNAETNMACGGP